MKKIAYITDIHLDEAFPAAHGVDTRRNWERILEDVRARQIPEIVFGGDIGERTSNGWFFDSLKDFELTLTPGNHDQFEEIIRFHQPSDDAYTLYYSKEDTYLKRIYLDSSSNAIDDTQFSWLETQVNTEKKLLLFIHHPVFPIDTYADKAFPLQQRDRIQNLLMHHSHEVLIFCGHYHLDDERSAQQVRQVVTPSAAFQMSRHPDQLTVDASQYGYRIITVDEGQVNSEVILFKA